MKVQRDREDGTREVWTFSWSETWVCWYCTRYIAAARKPRGVWRVSMFYGKNPTERGFSFAQPYKRLDVAPIDTDTIERIGKQALQAKVRGKKP